MATFQYSCLGNSTDSRAWQATVHGVIKSQTQLSDFQFKFMCIYKYIYIFVFCFCIFSPVCIQPLSIYISISQKLMHHQAEVHFIYHIRCMVSMGSSKKCCLKYLQTAKLMLEFSCFLSLLQLKLTFLQVFFNIHSILRTSFPFPWSIICASIFKYLFLVQLFFRLRAPDLFENFDQASHQGKKILLNNKIFLYCYCCL